MARPPNRSAQTKAVLSALSAAPDEWRYGYDLCKSTGIKSGTLYPLLVRLNEQGFLEAEWIPPEFAGRPPRHAYRLTPAGRALAAEYENEPATAMQPALRPLRSR